MEQIIKANESILNMIGKPKQSNSGYRLSCYVVEEPVEEGILVFNTLTRELLLLAQEEYQGALENEDLRQKWFVVPEDFNDKQVAQMVRWIHSTKKIQRNGITTYTILTTTDCNARCFYCYELGRSRVAMSDEVALKTAAFIKDNCCGKPVVLKWFGGEPLYNDRAIDLICDELRANSIVFKSDATSNGYLFDTVMVKKAVDRWNLKKVQITIDGTETVYNKAKAFIYRNTNAYQILMNNMQTLLEHDVQVMVRMNMDFYNCDDLMNLSEELASRFGHMRKFRAYVHLICDDKTSWDSRYSVDKWVELYEAKAQIEDRLSQLNIYAFSALRLNKGLPENFCIADSPNSILITPSGDLGKCEHYTETELIGHLDSKEQNQDVINSWRKLQDEIPECDKCFYYPECVRLKKCPDLMPCIEPERKSILRNTRLAMRNEFRRWKKANATSDNDASNG